MVLWKSSSGSLSHLASLSPGLGSWALNSRLRAFVSSSIWSESCSQGLMVNLCQHHWIEKYLGDQQSLLQDMSEAISRENELREEYPTCLGQHCPVGHRSFGIVECGGGGSLGAQGSSLCPCPTCFTSWPPQGEWLGQAVATVFSLSLGTVQWNQLQSDRNLWNPALKPFFPVFF